MNTRIAKTIRPAALAGIISLLTIGPTHAQTYTWDRQALGQLYLQCQYYSAYWPNNPDWTQAYATNSNCDGSAIITSAPSNWDPTPPVGLYPGGPGLEGVDVVIGGLVSGVNTGAGNSYLQGRAIINNLTLQASGSLNLGYITTLTVTNADVQGDTIIGPGSYAGELQIAAGGSLTKSGGTGVLGFGLDQYGNAVGLEAVNANLVVQSGTFAMPYKGAGLWFGGTFSVSNNATVILNVTNNSECALGGNITGLGGGTVAMTDTVLIGGGDFYGNRYPGLTLDFPGNMFQWSGGAFYGGSPVTNAGVLNLSHATGLQTPLYNNGTMNLADNSSFGLGGGGGDNVYNNAGAVFNIEGNTSISGNSIINYGLFWKSAGAGLAQINPFFYYYGGTVEVDAGTMALNGFYITNAVLVVSNGATLDLATVPGNFEIEGTLTGSGGGTVLMNNGTVFSYHPTTLNFPGSMFQWAGGILGGYVYSGYQPLTNAGTLNISGSVAIDGSIENIGAMIQSGPGAIGNGVLFNDAGAVYDIQNDNGMSIGTIYNNGLIIKSAGTGTSLITGNLENYGTNVPLEVDSGTLALSGFGNNYFTNATLVISNGATLDFEAVYSPNYATEIEGYLTGVGGGTLLVTNGTLDCRWGATLNFPGAMFQWAGGSIGSDYNNLANAGTINVSGSANVHSYLDNNGMMIQSGAGSLSGNYLYNNAGGVYDIQNDNGTSLNAIYNYGLIKKSAGTGVSTITGNLGNYGANVPLEVDSGTLVLNGNGANYFTNATLVISNGATLDFAAVNSPNYATEIEGYLNGVGGGTFLVTNGTIDCRWATTLNFPGTMFQWAGGSIGSEYNNLANVGTINVSGPANVHSYLNNNGTMIQSGDGGLSGNYLYNNAGAVYDIQNDNGMSLNAIYNYGLFEKTGGTGTSVITANVGNWGQIQATSGALVFTNATLVQNAGTLPLSGSLVCEDTLQVNGGLVTGVGTVGDPSLDVSMAVSGGVLAPGNPYGTLTSAGHYGFSMGNAATLSIVLGGTNQFSQLTVIGGGMSLAGTLNVTLANGYAPAIGTQFQIVDGSPRGSTFSSFNLPPGISLTYSNTGVYLIVTSAVPVQVQSPQLSGQNFTFSFPTASGQSYTVQQNDNLATTNWINSTNITGDGSLFQFFTPCTNIPQLFFRVRQP